MTSMIVRPRKILWKIEIHQRNIRPETQAGAFRKTFARFVDRLLIRRRYTFQQVARLIYKASSNRENNYRSKDYQRQTGTSPRNHSSLSVFIRVASFRSSSEHFHDVARDSPCKNFLFLPRNSVSFSSGIYMTRTFRRVSMFPRRS